MQKDIVGNMMEEYEKKCALYSAFAEKVEKLVGELLDDKGLQVHSITSRLKAEASLRNKLRQSEGKYSNLSDVPDVSGVRIITYYGDEVDAVARVIEEEFDIDWEYSVDKRALLDPDRFGYLSLHYVAKLRAGRLKLTEYRRFSDCKVEIQIRSILQHTWAEIEHDLGYKGKQSVPREIRRRFSRLAGLLEIADDEFAQIRDSLAEYEGTLLERISEAPESVPIDQASLHAFIKSGPRVQELDARIASAAKAKLVTSIEYISNLIDHLQYVGLQTIGDLDSSLHEFGDVAARLAELMIGRHEDLNEGISLWYLCYALAARSGSAEEVVGYMKAHDIGPHREEPYAKRIISLYAQAGADSR